MNLATHLFALIFAGVGVFLLSEPDPEAERMGLAAITFAATVWFVELGLRAHAVDLVRGAERRTKPNADGAVTFGPVRLRLALFAGATGCLAVTPALICGSVTAWPAILLGGPPLAASMMLTCLAADPRPLVRIDGDGLFDRRSMRKPLPWREIRDLAVDETGAGAVTVSCRNAEIWRRGGPIAAMTARSDGFLVDTLLLDGDAEAVMATASHRWKWMRQ